jgi:hypothetical protein
MHKKPHKGSGAGCELPVGGTSAYCQSGKCKSICTPIDEDGAYNIKVRKQCQCDNSKCNGTWVENETHYIREIK